MKNFEEIWIYLGGLMATLGITLMKSHPIISMPVLCLSIIFTLVGLRSSNSNF